MRTTMRTTTTTMKLKSSSSWRRRREGGTRTRMTTAKKDDRDEKASSSSSSSTASISTENERRVARGTPSSSSSSSVAFFAAVLVASQTTFVQPPLARATFSKSGFEILCPIGDEGTECRMKALAEDKGEYLNDAEYNKKSEKKKSMKTSAASTAGRNADLIPYQSDTIALADAMDEFFAMDLYSTAREPAIKQLQTKANDWTGKYCPGGSSKQASGRSMYNAVNQLLGHFASNGLAPLPSARMEVVNKNIETARELIAQGR